MDAAKRQRYEKIAEGLTKLSGGKDNIQGMSLGDLKTVANQKMNPFQRIIKALSDVFVDIMPGILAAPLLTGLSGVLGNLDFVHNNAALFGVNLLSRYPLIGGCIGGALGGIVVSLTDLAALGFGTTVLPGIALADPTNNGYVSYIIAHAVAIVGGFVLTLVLSSVMDKAPQSAGEKSTAPTVPPLTPAETSQPEVFFGYARGTILPLEEVKDETFASKVLEMVWRCSPPLVRSSHPLTRWSPIWRTPGTPSASRAGVAMRSSSTSASTPFSWAGNSSRPM